MWIFIIVAVVWWTGFFIGYIFHGAFLPVKKKDINGTIVVEEDELTNKVVYSLELNDYPELLRFKKMVVLKVDTPEKKHGRK